MVIEAGMLATPKGNISFIDNTTHDAGFLYRVTPTTFDYFKRKENVYYFLRNEDLEVVSVLINDNEYSSFSFMEMMINGLIDNDDQILVQYQNNTGTVYYKELIVSVTK